MLSVDVNIYGEFEGTRRSVYVECGQSIFLSCHFVAIIQHFYWFFLYFVAHDSVLFKLDTQFNKVPNHSVINKHKVVEMFSFFGFKMRDPRLFGIGQD